MCPETLIVALTLCWPLAVGHGLQSPACAPPLVPPPPAALEPPAPARATPPPAPAADPEVPPLAAAPDVPPVLEVMPAAPLLGAVVLPAVPVMPGGVVVDPAAPRPAEPTAPVPALGTDAPATPLAVPLPAVIGGCPVAAAP
jgi:hypothetical protein